MNSNWTMLVLVSLVLFLPYRTTEAGQLQDELTRVAQTVKKLCEIEGHNAISLGRFTGPPTFPSSGGVSVSVILAKELEKAGVTIKRRAPIGIKGEYFIETGESIEDEVIALRLEIKLVDKFGQALTHLNFSADVRNEEASVSFSKGQAQTKITDTHDLVSIMGPTVDLNPDTNLRKRKELLKSSLANPTVSFRGTEILANDKSPYSIEIQKKKKVNSNYVAETPISDEGMAFVELQKEDIYGIRLTNQSEHDAAVRLTIDGINQFSFADNQNLEFMVVPPGKSVLIKGWYRTASRVDSFQVGTYAESAAAEMNKDTEEIGTITATFSAAWDENSRPPKDELKANLLANRGERLATKRGPSAEQQTKMVRRHIGVPRAVISVRYALD